MGLDVGRVLHCVIRGAVQPESGERPQRWAGETTWDELDNLWTRFNVRLCVIDALPETTMVQEFQARHWGRCFRAYYVGQRAGTKKDNPMQWDEAEGVVNLDRTRTLDRMFGRFYAKRSTLPADAQSVTDYYDHMQHLVRVLVPGVGGQKVAQYQGAGADHFAHAENYENVAASLDTDVYVAFV